MRRAILALVVALAAVACVSAGQSKASSYEARQTVECHSVSTCRRLLLEIDHDLAVTADATPLRRVRDEVQRQLADYEAADARAAAEQKAAQEREVAAERATRAAKERREAEAERQRVAEVARWTEQEKKACKADQPGERCVGVPGVTQAIDLANCRVTCDDAIRYQVWTLENDEVTACTERYMADTWKRWRATATCTPDASQPHAQRVDIGECLQRCKSLAAMAIEQSKQSLRDQEANQHAIRAQKAADAAESRRRPAPADPHVMCCDWTRSPTCTTVHRGCCSHHGGVC